MYDCNGPIPEEIIKYPHYLFKILNWNAWSKYLSEKEKETLMVLLPIFPTNTQIERQKTLKMLFEGQVFGLDNPGQRFIKLLKDGAFDPKIGHYFQANHNYRFKQFHKQLHQYHCDLLQEIILLREETLQQACRLSCYTPSPKTDALFTFEYCPQLCPLLSQVLKRHKKTKCLLPFAHDTNPTIKNSWQTQWNNFKTHTSEFMSSSGESTDESNSYEETSMGKPKGKLHKKIQPREPCYSLGGSTDDEEQTCTVLIGADESSSSSNKQCFNIPDVAYLKDEESMDYERFLKGSYKRLLKSKHYQLT